MKKSLTILLVGILLLGFCGTTLAAPQETADTLRGQKQAENRIKVQDLQRYEQLRQLREEGKAIRGQIKEERVTLQGLIPKARETKDQTALPIIKQYRTELRGLRTDLKDLGVEQKANWQTMRTFLQTQDQGEMASTMNKIVNTRRDINQQLSNIKTTLAQFIAALSGK
ncbi:MAG: hypothetical protein NTV45_08845 [Firmicutes bacterium]|nr:hypothetical protein [Bacillota bacterium]